MTGLTHVHGVIKRQNHLGFVRLLQLVTKLLKCSNRV